jgi:hypothetical protein
MVVLCAGGDTSAPYSGTNYASPNSLWYDQITGQLPAAQPTSPSRFDVDLASSGQLGWPNPVDENNNPIPPPTIANDDRCYAILVGGNNASSAGTGSDAWGATSTAKGPDIDVLVPAISVPCANNAGGMVNTSGTSFSVGLVAGVAVAYLDHNPPSKTPRDFRNWLLPITSGPVWPAQATTAPWKAASTSTSDGWYKAANPPSDNSWYKMAPYSGYTGGKVPKISIDTNTAW